MPNVDSLSNPDICLISKRKTAEKCGISEASVTRYEKAGLIPHSVKMKGRRCWFKHEIDAVLLSLPRAQMQDGREPQLDD